MSKLARPDTACLYRRNSRRSAEALIVLGNCIDEDTQTIWCASWMSGKRHDVRPAQLLRLPDEAQPSWSEGCERCALWAAQGNHHAAWWLGWAYEGVNHPRSIWYYIASLRMTKGRPSWALQRIHADAYTGEMYESVPEPCLRFMQEIPEFNGAKSWGDWKQAITCAERAIHRPVSAEALRQAVALDEAGHITHPEVLRTCAVTEQGLARWLRASGLSTWRGSA